MRSLLNTERVVRPYPSTLTKKVGNTKLGYKTLYCAGIFPVKTIPLSPKEYGLRRANDKMHKRTNK